MLVQPVLLICTSLDHRSNNQCTDAWAVGLTGALISANSCPTCLDYHLDILTASWTSWIWFGLHPWDLGILQTWAHKFVSPIDYVVTQSSKSNYGLMRSCSLHQVFTTFVMWIWPKSYLLHAVCNVFLMSTLLALCSCLEGRLDLLWPGLSCLHYLSTRCTACGSSYAVHMVLPHIFHEY